MPTVAPKPKSNFEPAPQGTFLARCISFVHIGTVEDSYKGEKRMMDKIRLSFELPTKKKVFKEEDGEQPIVIHQKYTLSMGEKANLRKVVEGIIGTSLSDNEAYGFDVEQLVGKPCLITVKHVTSAAGNVRSEITNVTSLMEGQVCPDQINQSKILSFSSWSEAVFNSLPQFLRDEIASSQEYKSMNAGVPDEFSTINPEDIPL